MRGAMDDGWHMRNEGIRWRRFMFSKFAFSSLLLNLDCFWSSDSRGVRTARKDRKHLGISVQNWVCFSKALRNKYRTFMNLPPVQNS
jgi:hypothetical protein